MITDSSPVPKMTQLILPDDTPKPRMSYSPCIRAGNWLFTAGQLATDFVSDTGTAPEVFPPNLNSVNRLELETDFILNNLNKTIAAAGADMARDTVRVWDWYVLRRPTMEEFAAGNNYPEESVAAGIEVQTRYFDAHGVPAQTGIGCRELLIGNTILEIDVLAFHPDDGETTVSIHEPETIAPSYFRRQAGVRRGDWVFLSGQSALELDADGRPTWAPGCEPAPKTWLSSPVEARSPRGDPRGLRLVALPGRQSGRLHRPSEPLRGDRARMEASLPERPAGQDGRAVLGPRRARPVGRDRRHRADRRLAAGPAGDRDLRCAGAARARAAGDAGRTIPLL